MQPTIDDEGLLWSYHLYCVNCGNDWWSQDPFPDECPNCGEEPWRFKNADVYLPDEFPNGKEQ